MGLLSVDPGLIIWTIITFVILLFLLRKVAWKPILTMIDERERTIRDSLDQAEQARNEAEEKLRAYEQRLAEARKEARNIIAEGKESAEKIRDDIVKEAQEQQQHMLDDARRQINAEREKAIQEIRESVANIAISAASKIIGRQLDEQAHVDIIERSLQDMGGDAQ
ncbi:MAG TPA: F0F1 ATP synthase subunit B [bacterium]|nr:F0F1 ATP synthase subunit B [bacterium]